MLSHSLQISNPSKTKFILLALASRHNAVPFELACIGITPAENCVRQDEQRKAESVWLTGPIVAFNPEKVNRTGSLVIGLSGAVLRAG